VFRLDLHAKAHGDFREAEQDLTKKGGSYETTMKRVGIDFRIANRVQVELERELRPENPWKNVYVNVRLAEALEVRAGKFKVPFGYERMTGVTRLDFAYRTLLSNVIAPSRDVGVMAHGKLLRRVLTYYVGGFRHDGEHARLYDPVFRLPGEPEPKRDRSGAARLTFEPFRNVPGPRDLTRLYLGVSFTQSEVPEGLNSLHAKSLFGKEFVERVYTKGHRRRIGTEVAWMPGPFSVKGEYARATEQRKRQGLLDDDLSDFVTSAWYLSGTWTLTGEPKDNGVEPRKPLFQGGFGAVELAARYEWLGAGSALKQGRPLLTPRADPFLANAESIWTLGVNWYLNKWGKIAVNGMREAFQDPDRAAIRGRPGNWGAVMQLQFAM
jgi:phosphate-selective porin OprO/OprP